VSTTTITPRLKLKYNDEVLAQLQEQLGCNVMEVPRFEKIVVNVGAGKAVDNKGLIEKIVNDITAICGQKPVVTKAKKSIAGFKLREGNAIGVKVTLRGDQMWEFFDRPRSFDGRGNYTFGVTEQLIFPEINYDKIDSTRGMDITIVTTARTDADGKALLDAFGFPFKHEGL
jgi:large subunit ribosomal protein L5